MKRLLISAGIFVLCSSTVLGKEVPYTLEDRDRLIRVEAKLEHVEKRIELIEKRIEQIEKRFEQIDRRFELMEKRFERLENIMMWGFGLIFTSMVGMVGFVLWDRRSALSPAIGKARELEEREDLIEKALKEYAKVEPRFADILRSLKML